MMCTNAQVAQKVDACEGKDVGSKCIYTFFGKQWAGKCFLNSMQAHPWAGKCFPWTYPWTYTVELYGNPRNTYILIYF